MIIYIDDILVYFKRKEEHVEHLKYVLNKFCQNKFFTNKAKFKFAQEDTILKAHPIKGRDEAKP